MNLSRQHYAYVVQVGQQYVTSLDDGLTLSAGGAQALRLPSLAALRPVLRAVQAAGKLPKVKEVRA